MKIEQFRDALGKLFAESIDLPRQEILEELELQCDCLRDDISGIRIRPQPNEPTQNATQRANDQPVLDDRVRTNPPRPAHSRHPMFED
jgi:hypothetical protein